MPMDPLVKLGKSLEVAKSINSEMQALVNKMFEQAEATEALKKSNPAEYYEKSNIVFNALIACASQKLLADGFKRYRLSGHTYEGTEVAWDMFLEANPAIAEAVAAEKAAKQAGYKSEPHSIVSDDDGIEGDMSEDEDEDEDS